MKIWSFAFVLLPALLVLAMVGRLAAAAEDDVCPVHHVKMSQVELRMVYGLPSPGEFEEMKIAEAKFPYGRDYVLGGCAVRPANSIAGFLCPKCVEARAKWCRAHAKE
jgi:hypothetical protein